MPYLVEFKSDGLIHATTSHQSFTGSRLEQRAQLLRALRIDPRDFHGSLFFGNHEAAEALARQGYPKARDGVPKAPRVLA